MQGEDLYLRGLGFCGYIGNNLRAGEIPTKSVNFSWKTDMWLCFSAVFFFAGGCKACGRTGA